MARIYSEHTHYDYGQLILLKCIITIEVTSLFCVFYYYKLPYKVAPALLCEINRRPTIYY